MMTGPFAPGPSASGPRQRAALISLTRSALRSAQLAATIEDAVRTCVDMLGAPIGLLLQLAEPGLAVMAHSRGPISLAPGTMIEADAERLASAVCRDFLTARERARLRRAGAGPGSGSSARSWLSVLVSVEDAPWGRLVVADDGRRDFDPDDVGFLEAVAAVLGAAVERSRMDSRRAALAAFGWYAIQSRDAAATIGRAIDVARSALGLPMGAVVRRVADRRGTLIVVQSSRPVGLDAGSEYEVDPRLADAVLGHDPLVVRDRRSDDRFATSLLPVSVAAISLVAPAILVDGRSWGRLVAGDSKPRRFGADELEAMSAIADVLGAALQRWRREGDPAGTALLAGIAVERVTSQTTEVALLDRTGTIVWVNRAWQDFARANGGDPDRTGVGVCYPAVCAAAADPVADEVAGAIRAAGQGALPAPIRVLVPCHGARTARWFDMLISPRFDDRGESLGAAVTLSPAFR